jgi:hypothetical protein
MTVDGVDVCTILIVLTEEAPENTKNIIFHCVTPNLLFILGLGWFLSVFSVCINF